MGISHRRCKDKPFRRFFIALIIFLFCASNLIKTKGVEKPGLGKAIATALEKAGIVANANTVPFDPSPPFKPSGIRLGTPALTTQGMLEPEMKEVGELIATVISNYEESAVIARVKAKVEELCKRFPLYK